MRWRDKSYFLAKVGLVLLALLIHSLPAGTAKTWSAKPASRSHVAAGVMSR
jgi:hypothetical protein